MILALVAGLTAGLVHVFSGPDHLAAVAPLAAGTRQAPWKTGLQWGFGHTAGVLLIGVLLMIVREQLPVDAISANSERVVGGVLIAVGAWGLWCAFRAGARRRAHSHSHTHAGASFVMGTVHGLAGSSHLFGVLPALALPTREASALYLAGFGIGAVAGMTAFTSAIGMVSDQLERRGSAPVTALLTISSAAAVVVGAVWLAG